MPALPSRPSTTIARRCAASCTDRTLAFTPSASANRGQRLRTLPRCSALCLQLSPSGCLLPALSGSPAWRSPASGFAPFASFDDRCRFVLGGWKGDIPFWSPVAALRWKSGHTISPCVKRGTSSLKAASRSDCALANLRTWVAFDTPEDAENHDDPIRRGC